LGFLFIAQLVLTTEKIAFVQKISEESRNAELIERVVCDVHSGFSVAKKTKPAQDSSGHLDCQ